MRRLILTNATLTLSTTLAMTFALTLAGCGNSGGDDDEVAAINELRGTWSTGCVPERTAAGVLEGHAVATLTFNFSDFSVSKTHHPDTDPSCGSASTKIDQRITGTFTGGTAVTVPSGAKTYDSTATKVEITVMTEGGVTSVNQFKLCGYSDWQQGVVKDVTTAVCNTNDLQSNAPRYDIYEIRGDKLFFGAASGADTGDTPANRANTIDTANVYTKA